MKLVWLLDNLITRAHEIYEKKHSIKTSIANFDLLVKMILDVKVFWAEIETKISKTVF